MDLKNPFTHFAHPTIGQAHNNGSFYSAASVYTLPLVQLLPISAWYFPSAEVYFKAGKDIFWLHEEKDHLDEPKWVIEDSGNQVGKIDRDLSDMRFGVLEIKDKFYYKDFITDPVEEILIISNIILSGDDKNLIQFKLGLDFHSLKGN